MQRAFSLQPEEHKQVQALETEQRNLLAQLGQMSLEKKRITKRLPQIEEAQRGLVRTVVQRVGVEVFNAARIDGANLLLDIPDAPLAPPAPPDGKPNGSAALEN